MRALRSSHARRSRTIDDRHSRQGFAGGRPDAVPGGADSPPPATSPTTTLEPDHPPCSTPTRAPSSRSSLDQLAAVGTRGRRRARAPGRGSRRLPRACSIRASPSVAAAVRPQAGAADRAWSGRWPKLGAAAERHDAIACGGACGSGATTLATTAHARVGRSKSRPSASFRPRLASVKRARSFAIRTLATPLVPTLAGLGSTRRGASPEHWQAVQPLHPGRSTSS